MTQSSWTVEEGLRFPTLSLERWATWVGTVEAEPQKLRKVIPCIGIMA